MKRICVIGSLNMDLVSTTERFVNPGETIMGKTFNQYFGGKGANQAVALGKLGADITMFGKVGNDTYGETYLLHLNNHNIQSNSIEIMEGLSTGIALIEVESSGENRIILIEGANERVDLSYIKQHKESILKQDIFLLQLEIPIETIIYLVKILKEHNKTVILDPAPARKLPPELLKNIDYLTPNETELQMISGMNIENPSDLQKAARKLLHIGVQCVIHKSGKNGAYIFRKEEMIHIPGFHVNTIDTTAAGDSFNAGLAFGLSQNLSLEESVQLGNAVGALSTTGKGAQSAMPSYEKVQHLLGNSTIHPV